MGHGHDHSHSHGHDHGHGHDHAHGAPARSLTIALGLTATYMVVEAVGGLLTGSLALLADAGHMLSDAGALVVALVAARLAERPPDARQTMGYQRAEVLGAALNAGALLVLAVWIAVEAVERLQAPGFVHAGPMMVVAATGLLVNLVVAWVLHRGARTINTRAALLHVLGDALGSVGALTAGALVAWGGFLWADPAISLVISAILLTGSWRVLREVSAVLMHSAPGHVDVSELEHAILDVPGVDSVHALHVWTLRPGEDVLTVHIVVAPGVDIPDVCARVTEAALERVPRAHVTVQPERVGVPCRRPPPPHPMEHHHPH